jgi:hypothetical protein
MHPSKTSRGRGTIPILCEANACNLSRSVSNVPVLVSDLHHQWNPSSGQHRSDRSYPGGRLATTLAPGTPSDLTAQLLALKPKLESRPSLRTGRTTVRPSIHSPSSLHTAK